MRWQDDFRLVRELGIDYYITNEHLAHEGGRVTSSGEIFGYYQHGRCQKFMGPALETVDEPVPPR